MADTSGPPQPSGGDTGAIRLALVGVTLLFVLLMAVGAAGVRGTDQYWYVADVETVARGLPHVSNNLFPAHLLGHPPTSNPPFIHNILPIYLVAPVARLAGAYAGWLVVNGLASVMVALLICRLLAREVSPWAGTFGYAAYLLLPLSFWQSAQPLAEPCIALFSAAAVWLYGQGGRNGSYWLALGLILLLGYFSREVFLPLLLVMPIVFLLRSDRSRWSSWAFAGLLGGGFWIAVQFGDSWFPHSPVSTWKDLLAVGAPGTGGNMSSYFAVPAADIGWGDFARKVAMNLLAQVDPRRLDGWLFYMPFNGLAVLCVWALVTQAGRGSRPARLAEAGVAFLVVHVLTICLVQNQARYMLVALPAVLAGAPLAPRVAPWLRGLRHPGPILAAWVALLVLADIPLALRLRSEGREEAQQRAQLLASLQGRVSPSDSVLMEATDTEYIMVGYALRPRQVLFLEANRDYARDQLLTMRERSQATWLLCRTNSPLRAAYGITTTPLLLAPPSVLAGYGWYRFSELPPSSRLPGPWLPEARLAAGAAR